MSAIKIFRRLAELLDITTYDLPANNAPLNEALAATVKLTGTQAIAGQKTFTDAIGFSNTISANYGMGYGPDCTFFYYDASVAALHRGALGLGASALSNQDVSTTASPTFVGVVADTISSSGSVLNITPLYTQVSRLGFGGTGGGSPILLDGGSLNLRLRSGSNTVFANLQLGNLTASGTIENTTAGNGIILKSPDGTRYLLTVANGGTLAITAA